MASQRKSTLVSELSTACSNAHCRLLLQMLGCLSSHIPDCPSLLHPSKCALSAFLFLCPCQHQCMLGFHLPLLHLLDPAYTFPGQNIPVLQLWWAFVCWRSAKPGCLVHFLPKSWNHVPLPVQRISICTLTNVSPPSTFLCVLERGHSNRCEVRWHLMVVLTCIFLMVSVLQFKKNPIHASTLTFFLPQVTGHLSCVFTPVTLKVEILRPVSSGRQAFSPFIIPCQLLLAGPLRLAHSCPSPGTCQFRLPSLFLKLARGFPTSPVSSLWGSEYNRLVKLFYVTWGP